MFNDRGGAARGSRPADQRCFDHAEKLMRHATIARDALEDGIVRPFAQLPEIGAPILWLIARQSV